MELLVASGNRVFDPALPVLSLPKGGWRDFADIRSLRSLVPPLQYILRMSGYIADDGPNPPVVPAGTMAGYSGPEAGMRGNAALSGRRRWCAPSPLPIRSLFVPGPPEGVLHEQGIRAWRRECGVMRRFQGAGAGALHPRSRFVPYSFPALPKESCMKLRRPGEPAELPQPPKSGRDCSVSQPRPVAKSSPGPNPLPLEGEG